VGMRGDGLMVDVCGGEIFSHYFCLLLYMREFGVYLYTQLFFKERSDEL